MSNTNTGGPAFPTQQWERDGDGNVAHFQIEGMTLRDYFAAKAMQALVQGNYFDVTAKQAYEMADAMLKAREQ